MAFRVAYPPEPKTPAYRVTTGETVRSLLATAHPLAREDCVLQWTGPRGARYHIRVATEDLTVLAEADGLEEPVYRVAPEALEPVPTAGRIVWQVEATLPDGARETSRTFVNVLD